MTQTALGSSSTPASILDEPLRTVAAQSSAPRPELSPSVSSPEPELGTPFVPLPAASTLSTTPSSTSFAPVVHASPTQPADHAPARSLTEGPTLPAPLAPTTTPDSDSLSKSRPAGEGVKPPPLPTPGFLVQTLILLLIKSRRNKYLRRLWPKQRGLPHLFNFCIKGNPHGSLAEAHALQFIAKNTSIPVPDLFYAFTHKGKAYIVERQVKGTMAASGWNLRSEESKARIQAQLRKMVDELRSVPVPDGARVGNIVGGPLFDPRLPKSLYCGPFDSVRDFHKALSDDSNWDSSGFPPEVEKLFDFYKQAGNDLVLTHGDLSGLNIMVDGDKVVAIVDWETAGWFPLYWEYATAKNANPQNPYWADVVDGFIQPLPHEWEMDSLRRECFGGF